LKDNIATKSPELFEENLNTSAGSFALVGCFPPSDATVVKKLRDAGAIVLGKTNMASLYVTLFVQVNLTEFSDIVRVGAMA
jgi:Asp-tRNA(Asn)/Glu-tRNA(Gln) amidotransferase A subunit family amidase